MPHEHVQLRNEKMEVRGIGLLRAQVVRMYQEAQQSIILANDFGLLLPEID
jgi:hypothetical protein